MVAESFFLPLFSIITCSHRFCLPFSIFKHFFPRPPQLLIFLFLSQTIFIHSSPSDLSQVGKVLCINIFWPSFFRVQAFSILIPSGLSPDPFRIPPGSCDHRRTTAVGPTTVVARATAASATLSKPPDSDPRVAPQVPTLLMEGGWQILRHENLFGY